MPSTLKKIAILSGHNEYSTHLHFELGLKNALIKKRIDTQILPLSSHEQRQSLFSIASFQPDALISFCLFSMGQSPLFFGEQFNIPSLTICLASGLYALSRLKSPFESIAFVDKADQERFGTQMPKRSFFLPHAVPSIPPEDPKSSREIEYVFFGTFFDYEIRREQWRKTLCSHTNQILQKAIELFNPEEGYFAALNLAMQAHGPLSETEYAKAYYELEMYLRGSLRESFLMKHSHLPIHIYGKSDSKRSWKEGIKKENAFIFHSPINFEETLRMIKQTKFLFHHCPSFSKGLHERVLYGLLLGAEVITEKGSYLRSMFSDSQGVNEDIIHEGREERVLKGQKIVMQRDTWDQRIDPILQHLEATLDLQKSYP